MRLHVLDCGENVLRLVCLDMEHNKICSGIAKSADVAMRAINHQMHIQKHLRMLAHGLHDRDADRDIRHKNAVHHVNMDVVRTAGLDLTDVIPQRAEVRRENGRCNFRHGCHSDLRYPARRTQSTFYN